MTQVDDTHIVSEQAVRLGLPASHPRAAFAWKLRSAEIARMRGRQRQYETPAFPPGTAFAWTLRSTEIAGSR
jgi:hypothetical protein